MHSPHKHSSSTGANACPVHAPFIPVVANRHTDVDVGVFSLVAEMLGYTAYAVEAIPRNVQALHETLCCNPYLRSRLTVCHQCCVCACCVPLPSTQC